MININNFENFLKENFNNLRYSIYDVDDNLLFLDTVIHFEHKVNDKWVKVNISPKQFVNIKEKYPIYWDNEEWRCDFDTAFLEFRDFGPRGKNALIEDFINAINNKKYGPSWDSFINTLISGQLFAIVTSRGHEPKTIKHAIEYIIYDVLNDYQQHTMLDNLMKYSEFFNKTFDFLIDDYLNQCYFIGVMSNYFKKLFPNTDVRNVANSKKLAVQYVINSFIKHGKKKKIITKIGFSDDDYDFYNAVKNTFVLNKEILNNVDFYLFDTSDSNLKGGKKEKI